MSLPPPGHGLSPAGLAPSVAHLFAAHAEQQQPQQQQFAAHPGQMQQQMQPFGQQPPPHMPPQSYPPMQPQQQHGPPHSQGAFPGPFPFAQQQQPPQQQHLQHQPPFPPHMQHPHPQQQQPPHQFAPPPHMQLHYGPPPPHAGPMHFAPPMQQQQHQQQHYQQHELQAPMHPHAQMQMQPQQPPVQPQYLPSPPFPSAPPPSRQASELAHMQVCGPGSLLSQQSGSSAGDQPAELAVGVPLPSAHSSLRLAPDHKRLGGDEHTSTACTEFSSIPRDLAAEAQAGCLIAHSSGATLFALRAGMLRLIFAASADGDATERQSELLKGHTAGASVLDIAFVPVAAQLSARLLAEAAAAPGSTLLLVATLSAVELVLWQLIVPAAGASAKLTFKAACKVTGAELRRVRVQPVGVDGAQLALLHSHGGVSLLAVDAALSGAAVAATPIDSALLADVADLAWVRRADGQWLLQAATRGGKMLRYDVAGGAVESATVAAGVTAVDRLLVVPGTGAELVLLATNGYGRLELRSPLTGACVSSLDLPRGKGDDALLFSALELDPAGRCAVLAYRRVESTGEASDAGFFAIQLSDRAGGVRVFDFVSVFWQPSPIVSCSIVASGGDKEGETEQGFDLYAVEQKPVVKLHISHSAVHRVVTGEEQQSVSADAAVAVAAPHALVAAGSGELHGDDDEILEAHDAVPALRSSLPKLLTSPEATAAAASADSPPSPATVGLAASSVASALDSSSVSASPSGRMQSPGGTERRVDRGEMDAAALLDMGSPDYHSGRSSPAVGSGSFGASPARAQPVLRPRGNSVETRGGPLGAPSSQPTPASTPAPGTPSLRGASLPSSEVSSPLPSPLPSPRGSLGAGLTNPPSPFQPAHGASAASTTEGSAAQSPLISTPSSPLVSASQSPAPAAHPPAGHHLDESGMNTIPGTPLSSALQPSSSTATPAPTPLALSSGSSSGVSLAQMSTAAVSLHFLSVTQVGQDPSNRTAGAGAASGTLQTPMNTPASSVPSTPRLQGVVGGSFSTVALSSRRSSGIGSSTAGSGLMLPQAMGSSASLRVRTSGSTSPSPISSPSIGAQSHHAHHAYIKARSASMDRADTTGSFSSRLLSPSVLEAGISEEPAAEEAAAAAVAAAAAAATARRETPPSSVSRPTSAKDKQESTLLLRLDQLFSRHIGRLGSSLQQERAEQREADRARFDQLAAQMADGVAQAVEERLADSVAAAVQRALDEQLLPVVKQALAESGAGAGAGAADSDALGAAVVAGLRAPLQESFRSAFATTLLPPFQQSVAAMLTQIQQRVAAQTQQQATAVVSPTTAADEAAARRRELDEAEKRRLFERAEAERREKALAAQVADMRQMLAALTASQLALTQSVDEVRQSAAAVARSVSAGTPAGSAAGAGTGAGAPPPPPATPATPTSADVKAEIGVLLSQQSFDAALTRALSSGKLSVTLWACRQLEPRSLLSTPVAAHRLSAPVVLSLIQQLAMSVQPAAAGAGTATGADRDSDLRLALAWLRECVMAVSPADAAVAQFVRPVLRELAQRIDALRLDVAHPLFDPLRMVQQLVQVKLAAWP